jgi:hypothetical protein
MVSPRIAKFVTKSVFGLGVSALIGVMIKMEYRVDDKIDAHYDRKDKPAN